MPFLVFFAYIFIEIFVLVQASSLLGGWTVLGLLALSFFAGAVILQNNRSAVLQGRVNGVSRLVLSSLAGALLIIPGFVSDIIALFLLIPYFQNAFFQRSSSYFMNRSGFTRIFRFDQFAGSSGFNAGQGGFTQQEPEFRSDIKVTVIDSETGGKSEEHVKSRRKIDDSDIIDVDINKD